MTDPALRAECEKLLDDICKHGCHDREEELFMLLRFATQREAHGLRRAGQYAETLPTVFVEQRRATASIADWCEHRAKELEGA